MAALAHLAASTASPLPDFNSSLELEFDSFLNLDQSTYPISESMKSDPSLISQPSVETPDVNASTSDLAPSFSAPSHQYGDHPQQTGFPPNAIAHAMAYNESSLGVLQAGNQGYATPSQNFMHVKRENPNVDSRFVSLRSKSDVDFDTDNANLTNFTNSQTGVTRTQSFVNPTALAGNGMPLNVQLAPQAGRVYPGMHQQQAMARAMHQQRQGLQSAQHHMRQQQQQQQMQQNQFGQFANSGPSQPLSSNRPARPTDPIVEERISRLLQQMRQNGQNSESHQNSSNSLLPQMAKHKKDEEDMDEDERLLASEEGKKLTSKERRQLRNKVSARAFRSRRKEYITQLEGEVAAKASENNELRLQNQALMEENSRLTDLTRMLLSNPQFSDVLNELSASGLPQSQVQASTSTSQSQPQPQPQPQHQFQHQPTTSQTPLPMSVTTSNSSSNIAMVQDSGMDFYGAGWNSGIDMNYNPSIFAVLQVPDVPAVDLEMISGKTSPFSVSGFTASSSSSKLVIPQLERPAVPKASPISKSHESETSSTEPLDETDPCFALFVDAIPLSSNNPSSGPLNFQPEKPSQYKTIVDHGSESPSDSLQCLKQICSSMDAAYERVCQLTDYLL